MQDNTARDYDPCEYATWEETIFQCEQCLKYGHIYNAHDQGEAGYICDLCFDENEMRSEDYEEA